MMLLLVIFEVVLTLIAGLMMWLAILRWWHVLVIAMLWSSMFALFAAWVTGDVSRYVFEGAFSAGSRGKDEIVVASACAAIVLSLIAAAVLLWILRKLWPAIRRSA